MKKVKAKSYKKESRRIAERRRRRPFIRKIILSLYIVSLIFLSGFGFWVWNSGIIGRTYENIVSAVLDKTLDMGFEMKNLYLSGAKNVKEETLMGALEREGFTQSDKVPILGISLSAVKARLETIGWVKEAIVERQLPDSLHITIIERVPGAVWQNRGKLALVDLDGNIIDEISPDSHRNLPLLVGEDANNHIIGLLSLLKQEPKLMKYVSSAIRVGERRWNIRLSNGIEVKLPENNAIDAWHMLAKIERENNILGRAVKSIDMRVSDRVYIEPLPDSDNIGNNVDQKNSGGKT